MNFSNFYYLKEEFYVDISKELEFEEISNSEGKQIPVTVNPNKNEFIKIAKDHRSKYDLDGHSFSGVRIGVLNFYKGTPEYFMWPGGIYHSTMFDQLRYSGILETKAKDWDFKLVWDQRFPNSLLTEYENQISYFRMMNGRTKGELYKKFQKMFSNIINLKDIKWHFETDDEKSMIRFPDNINTNDDVDLSEPDYATNIRKFHKMSKEPYNFESINFN
jgi:hypothetical protein